MSDTPATTNENKVNLPAQPNQFIGRVKELHELTDLLADPECRLVTLVGPGGTGKTRLSVEVGRRHTDAFSDGVHFVPLDTINSTDFLVPAIAAALKFTLRGQAEPRAQLLSHLEPKQMLVILDNFEHVVDGAGLVSEMLAAAPSLKLVVTTREALALSEEWVFPVPGMILPSDDEDAEQYDAVRLFIERAQRVNRAYSPGRDMAEIARVCRLVLGLPLGIELAASWIKVMPCSDIVAEIEKNVDFLTTKMRNVPERHRTMRAVFEESWRLLDDDEKDVFARLSVIRGSFDRDAAEKIADASLPTLSALVDKSLIRPLPEQGRYRVHELLRQYAAERLAEAPERMAEYSQAYCEYYAELLDRLAREASAGRQLAAAAVFDREIDNIRVAFEWAVENRRVHEIYLSAQPISLHYQYRANYSEVISLLEKAARALRDLDLTVEVGQALAIVLVHLGWFSLRVGKVEEAESAGDLARDVLAKIGQPPHPTFASDPTVLLGIIATIKGDFALAAANGKQAAEDAEKAGNRHNLAIAHYLQTRAALLEGRYEDAQRYAELAYEVASGHNDRWFMGYCALERGNVAAALGQHDRARQHYQECYELREEFDDREGKAVALLHLAEMELQQRRFDEARAALEESIGIYREIQDKGGLAAACRVLGRTFTELNNLENARFHIGQAIALAAEIKHSPQLMAAIVAAGEVMARAGDHARGISVLRTALAHSSIDHETQLYAERVIREVAEPAAAVSAALEWDALVDILSTELSLSSPAALRAMLAETPPPGETGGPAAPAYPDGLTEREVEVLRLVARGRSNREIAEELFITANTVANHMKNILSKTSTANRTEAASYANDKGLT